jgi:hypothetical protein
MNALRELWYILWRWLLLVLVALLVADRLGWLR